MDASIELNNILKQNYADGIIHTHVSLIQPTGKFLFSRQVFEDFWDVYSKCVLNNVPIGIAEKPQQYIPVLVDVDIKLLSEDIKSNTDHLYNDKHVKRVRETFQSVLRNIVDSCNDEDLTCILLEKPMYNTTKNEKTYTKSGFHLHFPYLFLNKVDQEVHLIPRVQDILRQDNVFSDLGFEDSGNIIDKQCCKVPWLLYGSRKSEDMQPYKLSKVFDSEGNILSMEDAFRHYRIYNMRERIIKLNKENIENYLPRILSIIPYGREHKELKHGLISPLKEKIKKRQQKKNYNESVDENLKISKQLLPMLSSFRYTDFNEWIHIGWVLYNIGDGCDEALDQWLEFSAQDEDKYDESKCIYEWERMVKKDLSLGTLRYLASVDNPEAYKEFKKEQSQQYIKNSLNGSHNDIAKILFAEYGNEFVCSSVANKSWYQFVNHKWELIEDGIFLREKISTEIVCKFIDLGKEMFAKLSSNSDKAEEAANNTRLKQIQKIIANLKSSPFKCNIMRECCEVFYDKKFREKLDANPYIIGFKNGVYDLKLNIFRPGRPEDFLSKSMPIDYTEFNESDDQVHEVHNYLEKVFPDKSLRTYFMDQSSDVFVGGNHQKVVLFWTGEGDNAKSVTQNIFEVMLGPLAIKFNTSVVTGKKPSSGSAYADLARAGGGVRWAVLEEPDGDEMVNTGTLKHLSGNDTFFARELFEKGKDAREIKPQFKLIFICNKLPKMKYADKATWNRIRVIPFESTFCRPDNPAPETYEEQLLQKRFPMDPNFSKKIPDLVPAFAWVLLEHRKKITTRFEPEKVRIATEMYRKQNDIYRQFIEQSIICEDNTKINIQELYSQFKEWFKDGFSGSGQSLPIKSEVQEYFCKLWGEPEPGFTWKGYRIRVLQDDIKDVKDGKIVILSEDDLVNYEEDSNA